MNFTIAATSLHSHGLSTAVTLHPCTADDYRILDPPNRKPQNTKSPGSHQSYNHRTLSTDDAKRRQRLTSLHPLFHHIHIGHTQLNPIFHQQSFELPQLRFFMCLFLYQVYNEVKSHIGKFWLRPLIRQNIFEHQPNIGAI